MIQLDPAAVDLEEIEARRKPFDGQLSVGDVDKLIAAVEALRKRVAELEGHWKRSLTVEAHAVELAGVLEAQCILIESNPTLSACASSTLEPSRTALATLPAEALERSRARDEVWSKLLDVLETVAPYFEGEHHYDHPDNVRIRAARTALAKLDALKEVDPC